MRKVISILLLIHLVFLVSCEKEEEDPGQQIIQIQRDPLCDGLKNPDYFPIIHGMRWTFNPSDELFWAIDDSIYENEEWRHVMTRIRSEYGGTFPHPVLIKEKYVLFRSENGDLYQHKYPRTFDTNDELILIKDPVVGKEWFMDADKKRKRKIHSSYETVQTDSCKYFDCLYIKQFVLKNQVYLPEGEFYYKKGLGLVKYHTSGYNAPEWKELSSFELK